jgi:hypothetical protein
VPGSIEVESGTRSHAAQGFNRKFDWVQVVLLWLNLLLRSCDSNTVFGRVVGVVLERKKKKRRAWD